MKNTLDARLGSASEFVRQGAVFADIGCDHAYLSVFLLKSGRISRAICADIAEGPLFVARENAEREGVSSLVDFRLSDGLSGLDGLGITDIAICGMGGELIRDILDRAEFVRKGNINLILQPMSRGGELRRYLAGNGFCILSEKLSLSAGRIYACINARYDGVRRTISSTDAEIGVNTEPSELFGRWVDGKIRTFEKIARGKIASGTDAAKELDFIEEAKNIVQKYNNSRKQ